MPRRQVDRDLSWEHHEGGVLIRHGATVVRVSWEAKGVVRIGARSNGDGPASFEDGPMLDPGRTRHAVRFSARESEHELVLSDGALALHVDRSTGGLSYRDGRGELLFAEQGAAGGDRKPRADGSGFRARLSLTVPDDQALYGLGQHEVGVLDRRGHHLDLYQHNLKIAIPFLLSSRAWGLLWHCYAAMSFDDDASGTTLRADCVDETDYFVIAGDTLDGVIAGYRHLTGAVPIPPRWAFGFVQSTERYETQEQVLAVARRYAELGLPAECVVVDWQYWPDGQWGQKSFDARRFPDPEGMCREAHELGTRIMISVWPHMDAAGPDHAEFQAAGRLLANDRTYDAFDPEARALFWEQTRSGLLSHGFDAVWCDCSEPFEADWHGADRPGPEEQRALNVGAAEEFLGPARANAYSLAHSRGVWDGHRASGFSHRLLNLTRSAYPGQQRYGTFSWSGDVSASWDTLARQIAEGLNFAASGLPYWTCDVGGFFVRPGDAWFARGEFPDGVDDPAYRELFLRWFQYGCFLPMFRVHGSDTPREIWHFGTPGEVVYDTLVRFVELRKALVPYLYAVAGAVYLESSTMMRPLAFDFAHDASALRVDDQFLLGPSLMVCPVTRPQRDGSGSGSGLPLGTEATRPVYLPRGTTWIDAWTGDVHGGGGEVEAPAGPETIPVYARAGTILPLARPDGDLDVLVFPGADGEFGLYEDEGDGWGYEAGEYTRTTLRWIDAEHTLVVGAPRGSRPGGPATRTFHAGLVRPGHGWRGDATGSVRVEQRGEEVRVPLV
ncbi:glycoside hydrolase family 31 protein [Streptomyces sp. 4N509B]|uniref:glycoside hydrolase family 31 protein n=1 Tax=Streptomyces sp. 4N509B TaxID=3457413 RepID=UPI003FD0F530